jgi:hypothetical protein
MAKHFGIAHDMQYLYAKSREMIGTGLPFLFLIVIPPTQPSCASGLVPRLTIAMGHHPEDLFCYLVLLFNLGVHVLVHVVHVDIDECPMRLA